MKYSGIGGQAVIEGVMMRNNDKYAVAVRKPDGQIEVKKENYKGITGNSKVRKAPFIRGIFNFIDSLALGMSALTFSSSFYEDEDDEKAKKKTAEQKKREDKVMSAITITISVILAIGIFVVGPYFFGEYVLKRFIPYQSLVLLLEGILRLLMFIGYVSLISLMKDIKRVYMYHGAEHKCINCIEHGLELNVENVRNSSKEHKRCGTSFLLIVMCISILLLMLVRFDAIPAIANLGKLAKLLNMASRIIFIPIIAGISYEILRLAGTKENWFTNALSKPGLLLQGLTTREPDDEMIEVGIASVEAVFDWKEYLRENFEESVDDEQNTSGGDEDNSCCFKD